MIYCDTKNTIKYEWVFSDSSYFLSNMASNFDNLILTHVVNNERNFLNLLQVSQYYFSLTTKKNIINLAYLMYEVQGHFFAILQMECWLIERCFRRAVRSTHQFFGEVTNQITYFKSPIFLFQVIKMCLIIHLRLQIWNVYNHIYALFCIWDFE